MTTHHPTLTLRGSDRGMRTLAQLQDLLFGSAQERFNLDDVGPLVGPVEHLGRRVHIKHGGELCRQEPDPLGPRPAGGEVQLVHLLVVGVDEEQEAATLDV